MSVVEANIIINAPSDIDLNKVVSELQSVISDTNGRPTNIRVIRVDDPLANTPRNIKE